MPQYTAGTVSPWQTRRWGAPPPAPSGPARTVPTLVAARAAIAAPTVYQVAPVVSPAFVAGPAPPGFFIAPPAGGGAIPPQETSFSFEQTLLPPAQPAGERFYQKASLVIPLGLAVAAIFALLGWALLRRS